MSDERFENQPRSVVDSAIVRRTLAELVARRNLPHSCVEWPELHALIASFNYAAVSFLPRSHVSVARLISDGIGLVGYGYGVKTKPTT